MQAITRQAGITKHLKEALRHQGWVSVLKLYAELGPYIPPDYAMRRFSSRRQPNQAADHQNVWIGRMEIISKALFAMRYGGVIEMRGTKDKKEVRLVDDDGKDTCDK